jgi:hypothetical protein
MVLLETEATKYEKTDLWLEEIKLIATATVFMFIITTVQPSKALLFTGTKENYQSAMYEV